MEEVLRCENLLFGRYEPLTQALNWMVRPGEFWAVVGENGCGKSTLLKTLLGFLKPLAGQVDIAGERAYLAQFSDESANMPARVRDVVSAGLEKGWSGFIPFYAQRRADQVGLAMDIFNIRGFAGQQFRELSPGVQQRVLMARAVVGNPQLLLLDEATSAMDVRHGQEAWRSLAEYAVRRRCAIVAVTHNLHRQQSFFSHILAFKEGSFICGPKELVIGEISYGIN